MEAGARVVEAMRVEVTVLKKRVAVMPMRASPKTEERLRE
jgi:hypothetical protein